MTELLFSYLLFAVGAWVMGVSLLLRHRDRENGRPAREWTHILLTAIALFFMYPAGGFVFYSLIEWLLPGGEAWVLLWFLTIAGLVVLACSVWFYCSNKRYGNPMKQWHYAVSIVIGLLLTWPVGYFLVSEFLITPLLRLFR